MDLGERNVRRRMTPERFDARRTIGIEVILGLFSVTQMEQKTSFESIRDLLSVRSRPASQVVHSQLASESNYLHLLTSLQPPAKYLPDFDPERIEGQRRGASTVLLFSALEEILNTRKLSAWNNARRTVLYQGDNYAEYYSSVGSVGKLKDVETLQTCERALLRFASRRVATAFVRWREWSLWMRRESLGRVFQLVNSLYQNRIAIVFLRLKHILQFHKSARRRRQEQVSAIWLTVTRHDYTGTRKAFLTWKLITSHLRAAKNFSVQSHLLRFKVFLTQNYELKVIHSFIAAVSVHRTKVLLLRFNRWRMNRRRTSVEVREKDCEAGEISGNEQAKTEATVKLKLLEMTIELLGGFQFL